MKSNGSHGSVKIRHKVCIDTIDGTFCLVTFDGLPDGKEHVAWVYGNPEAPGYPRPIVRVHSECHTGDLWSSLRCDCGPQLAEARRLCLEEGRGVILYMRDEGRGIGLYDKVEAYVLQIEQGLNTYEANEALGHPADGRDFKVAGQILKALGIPAARLLTNNPEKVAALRALGLAVEMVPTGTYVTAQNRGYLQTKKSLTNHRLNLEN